MPPAHRSARLRWWVAALIAGLSLGVTSGVVLIGNPPAVLAPLGERSDACISPLVRGGSTLAAAVDQVSEAPATLTRRRCGVGLRVWDAPQRSAARDDWAEQTHARLGPDAFAAAATVLARQERQHRDGPFRDAVVEARAAGVDPAEDHEVSLAHRELRAIRGARTQAIRLIGPTRLEVPSPKVVEVAAAGLLGLLVAAAVMTVVDRRWRRGRPGPNARDGASVGADRSGADPSRPVRS